MSTAKIHPVKTLILPHPSQYQHVHCLLTLRWKQCCRRDEALSFSEAGLIGIFASVVSEDGMEGAEAAVGTTCRFVQSESRNSRDEKKICAESDVEISCLNSRSTGTA
jgi:hypothetical protein